MKNTCCLILIAILVMSTAALAAESGESSVAIITGEVRDPTSREITFKYDSPWALGRQSEQRVRLDSRNRFALEIPVVAGEYFPHQLHSYAQMVAMGAVDALKPAIDMGGITEMLKLAQLTFAFGATLHVSAHGHMWGFSSVNVNGAIENGSLLEVHPPFETHTNPAIRNPLRLSGGYVEMPEAPGLGVDLDWDEIEDMTVEVIE